MGTLAVCCQWCHCGSIRPKLIPASIFKRISEPAPLAKFGAGVGDLSQTYKVWLYLLARRLS